MTRCYFLLVILSVNLFSTAQNISSFADWEDLAIQQPENTIEQLKSEQPTLSNNQKSYLTATAYQKTGKLYLVDSLLTKLLESNFSIQDSSLYIKSLALRAEQLRLTSELKEALIELNRVIAFYERNKDTSNLVNSYISLSQLYLTSGDYGFAKMALFKAEKLINLYSKEKLKYLLAILNDAKVNFSGSPEFPESKEFYSLKSLEIAREIKNKHLIATACNQLGVYYYEQLPPDSKSDIYLKEAVTIWDSIGYDVYWLNGLTNLTRYYGRVNRNQEALDLLLAAKNKVESASFKWGVGEYYDVLGKIYAKLGNYKTAYLFKRKASAIKYDNEIKKIKQQLSIYTYKLEAKEKEEIILKSQQQIELTELKLEAERKQKKGLFLLLFAAIIILAIAFYSRRRIHKQRNELAIQKDELAESKVIISKNNSQLKELVQQREALLHEVNHRVKNNLTVLSSLLFLQSESIENPEAKVALLDSQLRVHSISLIHESLYRREDMEKVDFHDYISNLFEHIKSIYKCEEKVVTLELGLENFQPQLKESVPIGMILNELITNSFKYAFKDIEDPRVSIIHAKNKIIYSDNGPGFSPTESSSSIGLQLISIFAIQLKAKVQYELTEHKMKTIIQF